MSIGTGLQALLSLSGDEEVVVIKGGKNHSMSVKDFLAGLTSTPIVSDTVVLDTGTYKTSVLGTTQYDKFVILTSVEAGLPAAEFTVRVDPLGADVVLGQEIHIFNKTAGWGVVNAGVNGTVLYATTLTTPKIPPNGLVTMKVIEKVSDTDYTWLVFGLLSEQA